MRVVLNSIYIMLWVVPPASPTVQCRATCEQVEGVGTNAGMLVYHLALVSAETDCVI